jgi:flagellar protein FliL
MVAQRAEPARGAEEKPRARQAQTPEGEAPPQTSKSGPGWKAWLPLALAVTVMPLLAFGVTSFVLVPRMQKSLAAAGLAPAPAKETKSEGGSEKGGAPAGQKQTAAVSKLLVNVAGTMGSRYLLTSVTMKGQGSDFAGRVAQNEPQLRDMACGLLSTKTIVDLEKPGARNMLRGELLSGFNSILGNGAVEEIYFTEFSIQ